MSGRDLARTFVESYADGDLETARSLMAEDAVSYVTNAEASVDRLDGRDDCLHAGAIFQVYDYILVENLSAQLIPLEAHRCRSCVKHSG